MTLSINLYGADGFNLDILHTIQDNGYGVCHIYRVLNDERPEKMYQYYSRLHGPLTASTSYG